MRGRAGVRKAVVGGAVVAVVGLVLLSNSGMPLIVGRAPTTSNPDPVGVAPGGPIADLDALQVQVRLSQLYLEREGLSEPGGPQGSAPAADLRAPVEFSVRDLLPYVDAEVDGRDGIAEFDRDGDEVRSEPGGSTPSGEGALASALLVLIVLEAWRDQDRDRRLRAAAPASAA